MSINRIYHTWLERIRQQRPGERITRLRSFAWIASGILSSRSVHLSRIADKIPGMATTVSKTRRVRRFLNNGAIRVREWYEPIARNLLNQVVNQGLEVRLLADGTKVGFGHQLLVVALPIGDGPFPSLGRGSKARADTVRRPSKERCWPTFTGLCQQEPK